MALVSSAAKEYTCEGRGGAQRPLPGSPLCGASPGGRAIQRALGGRGRARRAGARHPTVGGRLWGAWAPPARARRLRGR